MPSPHTAPLLIAGGYGLVGARAARLLRQRHPDLAILLGGRNPGHGKELGDEIGATVTTLDVRDPTPLSSLPVRPAAVLATVSDPDDRMLVDAMRSGIPIADINRAGHAGVLDVAVHASRERPSAAVLLSGSWLAGLSALMSAAVVAELGAVDRIDVWALSSSDDRVGPDSWGFAERLAWPYHVMRDGRRRPAHPMTDVRRVRCADGRQRPAALIGTLEQTTLPHTLGVPTVETRMALRSAASLYALVALKRTGALRLLARPALHGVRAAILQRPGAGDVAGITVTGHGPRGRASVDLLDPAGQAHLSAIGAVCAAERLLGLGGSIPAPAGISFPEQLARPADDIALLRAADVQVRRTGFDRSTERPREESHSHD